MVGKKTFRRAGKLIIAFVLAGALCFAPLLSAMPTASAVTLDELKKKQADLEKRQKQNAEKLKQLKSDKAKQQEYKNTLDDQIGTIQEQIDGYNEQLDELDGDIAAKQAEIADRQASIDGRYEKLKERLCALYMMGEASNLELILNAENVMDLSDKLVLMQAITEHDTDLIEGLRSDLEAIGEEKESIESNRQEVAGLKESLDAKQKELTALEKEAQAALDELAKNEKAAASEQSRLDAEEAKAADAIDEYLKDYYANQGGSGGGSGGSSGSSGYQGTGNFIWPLPGYTHITSKFGAVRPNVNNPKPHGGIDIAGSSVYGKPIIAADGGKVLMAGNIGGSYWSYGNFVMIDHGNGYVTIYAHASKVLVKSGQIVKQGQEIAKVGNSGNSYGAHLHFEVRKNGTRVNPMNFFK